VGSCAKSRKLPLKEASTMEQNMSKSLTMLTLGGRVQCRQCQATAKHSRVQCKKAALRGKNVCRTHGGASTGPRTEQGRAKCAEARTIHGNSTREKRKQNAVSATRLLLLRALGNRLGLFGPKPTGWAGRRPKDYPLTEEMTTEALVALIERLPSS
jgi:ribosomal protein S4